MRAMVLDAPGQPLRPADLPVPEPGRDQVLVRVLACGVCRTDLHIRDGEVRPSAGDAGYPVVCGHQIVGERQDTGARVGIPWLGWTCGVCRYCTTGRENLCDAARFTGLDVPGGFAEWTVADPRFCLPLPDAIAADPVAAAPLLCAGLIGHRTLRLAGDAPRLGIYGFGAAAHLVCQVAVAEGREVYALTSPGDEAAQAFARELGAVWAGGSDESPPVELDAALIFAPVGPLVPAALRAVAKGGSVVCGGIHMSDIPGFPYADLWGERVLRSVANLTREDGALFLDAAQRAGVTTRTTAYALEDAERALEDLRTGRLEGAAVLDLGSG
ncbi:MAG: zinc-dependent alcohol dehydrogenase family protein [Solirubrobacteraceae bacterium]|nr:zinc-dependent alcohol dehydrogenase family protein [Solirubrobacteraceae bacterium]